MTQIEFIRAEVEKLKGELPRQRGYKRNAYNHVLRIIDSAPKELPTDKLDELKRAWYQQGFHDAKEQMIKDAIDTVVVESYGVDKVDGKWENVILPKIQIESDKLSIGDKVKVVIMK